MHRATKQGRGQQTAVLLDSGPADETATYLNAKPSLRVWLRLLTCTNQIGNQIRTHLRTEFDATLPRFDVLAELDASGRPLTMGELSDRLMVTTGNVTGLIDAMEHDRLVRRIPHPSDRRSILIDMTKEGRDLFSRMAPAHKTWLDDILRRMTRTELDQLLQLLDKLTKLSRIDS